MNTRHYRAGDRLWFKDQWGRQACAAIVGKTPFALLIRRDDCAAEAADEMLDLDDCQVSRHFPLDRPLTKRP